MSDLAIDGHPYLFDTDTDITGADGHYRAYISSKWNIGKKPNGGYMLSIVNKALRREADRPSALSITAHYVKSPDPGPVTIDVETVKSGRTVTNMIGRMYSEGVLCLVAIGTYGDLDTATGQSRTTAIMPEMPPPERCVPMRWPKTLSGATKSEIENRFELLIASNDDWLTSTSELKAAELRCWIRFSDRRPMDTDALMLVIDAAPPALLGVINTGWVPTIDLTVHIRSIPIGEWILARFKTDHLIRGFFEEDGELWDRSGQLVAISRQQAMMLAPRR